MKNTAHQSNDGQRQMASANRPPFFVKQNGPIIQCQAAAPFFTPKPAVFPLANVVQLEGSSAVGLHRSGEGEGASRTETAASIMNGLLDIEESLATVRDAEKDTSERVAAGADLTSKGASLTARGMEAGEVAGKDHVEAVGHAAELLRAGIETWNALSGIKEAWGKGWSDVIKQVGEVVEKIADVITAGADILKDWFESFKELEVPWAEALQKAALVIQKGVGFLNAWNQMSGLQVANEAMKAMRQPRNRGNRRQNRQDELRAQEHLIGLNWDRMKQNAYEIMVAGSGLLAKSSQTTGIGVGAGAVADTFSTVAEATGRTYVKALRGAREWRLWYTDQTRTKAYRRQIAEVMIRLQRPILFEAAGVEEGDRQDVEKVMEALEEHN